MHRLLLLRATKPALAAHHIVAWLARDTPRRLDGAQATAAALADSYVGGRRCGLPWTQPL